MYSQEPSANYAVNYNVLVYISLAFKYQWRNNFCFLFYYLYINSFHPMAPFLFFIIRQQDSLFMNRQYLCSAYMPNAYVPMLLVFLGGENGKFILWNFFEHPKKILRPADLNLFLYGQPFAVLVLSRFHVYIKIISVNDNGAKLRNT